MRKPRWSHLLDEDPTFRRWYENLFRGSEWTARTRARDLYRFLTKHDLTPGELVEVAQRDQREAEDILMDFISELHRKEYSPGYIENYLKTVRSWLEFNDIRLVRRIKIGRRNRTPTIEDERVPTRDELGQILNYASERGRCSIALMAFSGLRPHSLGNMRGTDGLEVKDLPDLKVAGDEVVFSLTPARLVVRPELNKAGHRYFTFLPSQGCEYVKAYLEKRLAMGEDIGANSAIIAVKPGYEEAGWRSGTRDSGHITTKTLTKEIRDAIRPKYNWRPYVLRAYFDTQLMVAENHGKLSHAYRQFFMGHKGDIEARYTTSKGRLPEAVIEDMRHSFLKCEEYLSTRPVSREEDPELTTIRTMVESRVLDLSKPNVRQYLFKKLGIKDMDVRIAKVRQQGLGEEEAYVNVICNELGVEPIEIEISKPKNHGHPKKVVSEDELESYLAEGWDVQTVLPSGKILVRRDY